MTGITSIQEMTRPPSASSGVLIGTLFSALQATTHAWQPMHLSTAFFSCVNRYGVRGLVPALVVFGNERRRRQTTKAAPGRSTWFRENAWQRRDGGARVPKRRQVAALHKRTRF
jgi:hypothetical protein